MTEALPAYGPSSAAPHSDAISSERHSAWQQSREAARPLFSPLSCQLATVHLAASLLGLLRHPGLLPPPSASG